jgi:hypothetical protein
MNRPIQTNLEKGSDVRLVREDFYQSEALYIDGELVKRGSVDPGDVVIEICNRGGRVRSFDLVEADVMVLETNGRRWPQNFDDVYPSGEFPPKVRFTGQESIVEVREKVKELVEQSEESLVISIPRDKEFKGFLETKIQLGGAENRIKVQMR